MNADIPNSFFDHYIRYIDSTIDLLKNQGDWKIGLTSWIVVLMFQFFIGITAMQLALMYISYMSASLFVLSIFVGALMITTSKLVKLPKVEYYKNNRHLYTFSYNRTASFINNMSDRYGNLSFLRAGVMLLIDSFIVVAAYYAVQNPFAISVIVAIVLFVLVKKS